MAYEPYGDEWQAHLKTLSFKTLFEMFEIKREGESKKEYILKIRKVLISKQTLWNAKTG